MTKPVDHPARRRFVDLLEQILTESGCETAPALARYILARLDAAKLRLIDAHAATTLPAAAELLPPGTGTTPIPDYLAAKAELKGARR